MQVAKYKNLHTNVIIDGDIAKLWRYEPTEGFVEEKEKKQVRYVATVPVEDVEVFFMGFSVEWNGEQFGCDLEEENGYLYTTDAEQAKQYSFHVARRNGWTPVLYGKSVPLAECSKFFVYREGYDVKKKAYQPFGFVSEVSKEKWIQYQEMIQNLLPPR